jgi:hypothetical protein
MRPAVVLHGPKALALPAAGLPDDDAESHDAMHPSERREPTVHVSIDLEGHGLLLSVREQLELPVTVESR